MSDEIGKLTLSVPEDPLGLTTVKDAARTLAVPVTYLQREVKAGRVPFIKMGSRTRVNVKAVEAALKRQAAGMFADQLYGELPSKGFIPSSHPATPLLTSEMPEGTNS